MDCLEPFLYLLMRDHLPTGVVAELTRRAQQLAIADPGDEVTYTSPELAALAHRYAMRLRPDPEAEKEIAEEESDAFMAAAPLRILEALDKATEGGGGLTLVELADECGWEPGYNDELSECEGVLQELYNVGAVQRDLGDHSGEETRYLITVDGGAMMKRLREEGR